MRKRIYEKAGPRGPGRDRQTAKPVPVAEGERTQWVFQSSFRRNLKMTIKKPKESAETSMEMASAVRCMIDTFPNDVGGRKEEAALEGFMSIFFPKNAADRQYMAKLKGSIQP